MPQKSETIYDVFIAGGGINGVGVARDAAGRGYSVCLCEMNDFASGTSSCSSKLIHGGLRYLEQYEFRLVQESLKEREEVPEAKSFISHRQTEYPRPAASRATPTPFMPPPAINTS
jgi:glycerol-3-phosphate dehydrogenase